MGPVPPCSGANAVSYAYDAATLERDGGPQDSGVFTSADRSPSPPPLPTNNFFADVCGKLNWNAE